MRGDQNTFASNPAMLKLSTSGWLAANPWVLMAAGCLLVAGVMFLFIKLPVGIVLLLTAVILPVREIRAAKQKFWNGDVCPGVVLSAKENLVAVYADLVAAGDRPDPVIQILRQPLPRMTTGQAYDGMRVATAAFYIGNARDAAWKNFWPEVINCVIHDPAQIERVLGSIPEEQWQMLEAGLARVPRATPGLHHIDLAGAGNAMSGGVQSVLPKPWFASRVAILALVAFGLVVAMFGFLNLAAFVAQSMSHHASPMTRPATSPPVPQAPMNPPPHVQPGVPPPPAVGAPRPGQPTQTGPFSVGSAVEAKWAGGWIPGKITSINFGGFSVFVQLEDSRFPQPIVLGTNQIRLK